MSSSNSAEAEQQSSAVQSPKVIIIGAGIAGLFLGILLDKASITYDIYERAEEVHPQGSVLSLNANILVACEQLGLYEELLAISARTEAYRFMYDDLKTVASLSLDNLSKEVGYDCLLLPHHKLFDLLKSKVSIEKVHFGKKVTATEQSDDGVSITCEDGAVYRGDILVGADGINSGVRQRLFSTLKKENKLPWSDLDEPKGGYVCLMGTTSPLDTEEYPFVKSEGAVHSHVVGESNFSWSVINISEHRVGWIVVLQQTSITAAEANRLRNSAWATDMSEETLDVIKNFDVPGCRTMGWRPLKAASAVSFSKTSYSKLGTMAEPCLLATLLSSAGQGAVSAMQDAVILANCLYDLPSLSQESICTAFQNYKSQRYPRVKEQADFSKTSALFLHGQTLWERGVRFLAIYLLPQSVKYSYVLKASANRPAVAYLPQVPKRGTGAVLPQQPSKRFEREQLQTTTKKDGSSKTTDIFTETEAIATSATVVV